MAAALGNARRQAAAPCVRPACARDGCGAAAAPAPRPRRSADLTAAAERENEVVVRPNERERERRGSGGQVDGPQHPWRDALRQTAPTRQVMGPHLLG